MKELVQSPLLTSGLRLYFVNQPIFKLLSLSSATLEFVEADIGDDSFAAYLTALGQSMPAFIRVERNCQIAEKHSVRIITNDTAGIGT